MSTAIQKLPTYIQEKVSTANVPIQYTAAVKALAECQSIDDAKYFADKADALAAWAKIYKSDQAAVEAKRLKLHAFRRMGLLANEIQPVIHRPKKPGRIGGPIRLLENMGLSRGQAQSASVLSKMTKSKFQKAVTSPTPRAPSYYQHKHKNMSDSWKTLNVGHESLAGMCRFCSKHDPKKVARGLTSSESVKAKEMAIEIIEWLDTLEQYLPEQS